ncbi:putative pyridine nucleotide-disulfide oxidoreductase AMID-like [Aspergillus saccharolyticus JOP 1030-1]|uniref:FAD/NAD(P)-binding domain-containing protein n=1 Tax=Aspergillus saccharolyticus JOP 1030-1 TaxID=1450539 RepID=A0A318ZQS9_9EURO|nr:FAD/NAD(P)-binding domain-containing protein [Aspergillus saccharolyticus JOP 1030-1]PYH49417.1 FAD/NAD(P)-binding domain-containing protein [Aspergillus saccharolyticus JOP 1030-1]
MPSNEGLVSLAREFRVLIVGGSYGGLSAAMTLLDLCRGRLARFNFTPNAQPPRHRIPIQITLVDERDGYYHLIGSPKALASEKYASKTWNKFVDIPALKTPDVKFIRGSVHSVDCQHKVAQILDLQTRRSIEEKYDFLIAASGLRRAFPTVPQSLEREEFLQETRQNVAAIQNAEEGVVVIGGGAVGAEMAAELKDLYPNQKITLIHSRDRLLSAEPLPDTFKERICSILREQEVEVILGQRVVDTTAVETEGGRRIWELTLSDGTQIKAGHLMNAVSKSMPTSTYLPRDALDEHGLVKIRPSLQFPRNVPNADDHFAVGDIVSWSGIKRCGAAIHKGHYAGTNLHQLMLAQALNAKPEFVTLTPHPPVMAIALGKTAVAYDSEGGLQDGEETYATMFGDDMGFSICWNYMKLSEPCKA